MVLEATMICIDNSEWMRNGDYSPCRLQAQTEAVNLLCGAKTQSNPENTVGILTMAGKGVRVLTTPTSDLGKILACMHGLDVGGEINLTAAIQIAQLALKHRQNKNQRQRIIVFAGSPIKYEKKALEIVGKRLKKNSVSLDIVNFGEDDDEEKPQKLEALLSAVNNNDGSHIVHVPSGSNALSDVLLSTPVFTGDEGASGYVSAAAAAAAAGGDFDFGVDPNIDPELALALRVSMEEERARQEAAAKKAADEAGQKDKDGDTASASASQETVARTTEKNAEPMDEDSALLDQAIAMSVGDVNMSEAADEDQDLALALQMSMSGEESSEATGAGHLLGDQAFISSVLSSLPGVDPNDPEVKALLASLPDESKRNEEDESTSKGEDEKKK
ncbi:PREDICTED: 26S proteasome non-ATPase regulatory subunit 4 homolog [Camelina sativa]|uniref:26S proteasome regulatory subunit RPN10 n=1 Tax=Camelina sativa TaxID=90675 RepID=A0ABM0UU17_CAMSA|nr:PREDICTED: 26S proteasome non-ATPase regulatory subunit 4 homolog [Camelina sativa]